MAPSIARLLSYEPAIKPNFSAADLPTIVGVILVLIAKGRDSAERIASYLQARGAAISNQTVEFILQAFEGRDDRQGLWTRNALGRYVETDPELWTHIE